eukprot:CAMPEP_0174306444 /NCGR_PEP_ID=MMETSP0810-20121108/456_1 /TAXON_ID=73025 ORGANISM="Eutreptiella gymnastica-like, Strain CCMP1594" /NCGR_SAMPLE_ID=MMETSP0810 /ASSEMBLY_ACC=CAM_ASM_000659 /LENGTH=59 /DNA_ID=CAMNT_0015413163 /DNA_START=62 /DNA_END=241 /DNA_ORIENTATION=+
MAPASARTAQLCSPDMPLASGKACRSRQETPLYYAPPGNAGRTQNQNSVGICCIQCLAQ